MPAWNIFRKKQRTPQRVSSGRFEIERDGETAYLEYALSPGVLELIETIVPEKLRRQGLAAELAKNALEYARANQLKVDVICPLVAAFMKKHPEYQDLVME